MLVDDYFIGFLMSFLSVPEGIRKGQHLFNMLAVYNRPLAELVRGNDKLDPFYVDARIEAFLKFVIDNWKTPYETK